MGLELLYDKAIRELSALDFESEDLWEDGEVKPELAAAVTVVAGVFDKSEGEVFEALGEQRAQEAEDKRIDDELRYGHLNEYGETPEEAARSGD